MQLLLGRARSGKSARIFDEIARNGTQRRQLLLVPEQISFETEQRLCRHCGNSVSLYAEVFSFTSLAERVFSAYGGKARPLLDEAGRILMMYEAMQTVKSQLRMFGRFAHKPEILESLVQAVDELKSYCVTPHQLQEIAEVAQGSNQDKLRDLSLLYGIYDEMTRQGSGDPRERLTRLEEMLLKIDFAEGIDVYIHGFLDFTLQEERVIAALLRKTNSLTVSLTCDLGAEFQESTVFLQGMRTVERLRRMAKEQFIPCREETLSRLENDGPIFRLEESLLQNLPVERTEARGAIGVFTAEHARQELLWAAGKIRELVKEKGIRYRDIVVSARDMGRYRHLFESIFSQADIPIYQSQKEDILQKPVFVAVTAALESANGNFAYEPMFRYLKSGLSNLSLEECDSLENYVLLWKIKGGQWKSKKGFLMHPRGFHQTMEEEDQKQLDFLNKIRCKVIEPYSLICGEFASVSMHVTMLYSFLEAIELPAALARKRDAFLKMGEVERAQEYDQMWDILCRGLEQCDLILGEREMGAEEFSRLLPLVFSQYQLGTIPLSLDRVIVGDLPRLSNRRMQILFLLGADERSLPQIEETQGILGVYERELLSDYGVPILIDAQERLSRELYLVYRSCTQPTKGIFVSWSKGAEGAQQPSYLIRRLQAIFSDTEEEERNRQLLLNNRRSIRLLAFDTPELSGRLATLPEHRDYAARLKRAQEMSRGRLSRKTTERLYGKQVAMSASRIDRYNSCHFSYYMQYGLRAKTRKSVSFDAPEFGTLVHYVLEHILRQSKEEGGIRAQSRSKIAEMLRELTERYAREELGGLEEQTPRFRYLFLRLQRLVALVVENVLEELRNSEFEPAFFELAFGRGKDLPPIELEVDGVHLSISGVVDRVDCWKKDGKLYIRVLDYKTGKKSLDLTEVWNGIGLQLLLYLFALEDQRSFFGGDHIVPAGALYLPARDVVVEGSRDMDSAAQQRKMDKELIRNGLLLHEDEVLGAMEQEGENGLRFLPIKRSAKTGKWQGGSLVTADQLQKLKEHIIRELEEICLEIQSGIIAADPSWRGESKNACQYCDFKPSCHFDEGLGVEKKRWMSALRSGDFWRMLEEEREV